MRLSATRSQKLYETAPSFGKAERNGKPRKKRPGTGRFLDRVLTFPPSGVQRAAVLTCEDLAAVAQQRRCQLARLSRLLAQSVDREFPRSLKRKTPARDM